MNLQESPNKKSKLAIIILIGLASLAPNWYFLKHKNHYTVTFADVSQGDSVVIRTPTNCTMVIDGGVPNLLTDQIKKYLPPTENKIDLMVLSHPHLDHMGGLIQLLNRYKVENIFTTGVKYGSSFYTEFERIQSRDKIETRYVKAHEQYYLCGLIIEIIYPHKILIGQELENVNNASIVLRLKIKDKWIYFSGDAELEAEEEIVKTDLNLESYIMKAGHHGSKTSNSLELLERVNPEYLVIQSGEGNSYGHPNIETLEKAEQLGIKIRRNDIEGSITFVF